MAVDPVELFRPVLDEQAQRGSVPAHAAGHDLRGERALVRVPLTAEDGDAPVRRTIGSKDRREPGRYRFPARCLRDGIDRRRKQRDDVRLHHRSSDVRDPRDELRLFFEHGDDDDSIELRRQR